MNSISFFISRMFIWDDSLYGPTDLGIKNAILALLPTHGITLDKVFNLSEAHMKTKVPVAMLYERCHKNTNVQINTKLV